MPEISPAAPELPSAPSPAEAAAAPEEFDGAGLQMLELRHRMKNMLAIVQSVANQTLRSGRSIDEARRALDGRLVSMGRAVDMLLQTAWSGADLRDVIADALVHGEERISIAGEPVALGADAAMALSLVFHELECNAVKYGALSIPAGAVTIDWTLTGDDLAPHLSLEWREQGGPPCLPPSRRGFGSRMISKLAGARFGGRSETDYSPQGLRWRFEAPLAKLGT